MAKKVQLKDKSGNKAYPVTSSACVGMSDGSGNLDNHINKITTEYNVSLFHPTDGVDGGNKYTLETAIAKVPAELRNVGLKCSFLDEGGQLETWEYQNGSFTSSSSWKQSGIGRFEELDNKNRRILTDTATTDKADIVEKAIIELKIFKDENTEAYINSFTGKDITSSPMELNIKIGDETIGTALSGYELSYKRTNLYDDVWLYENDNLRAIIDFSLVNGYIINAGASNNHKVTGINKSCYIKNRYYYNSLNNLKKDISDTESSLNTKIDDKENVYQNEVISNAFVITGKAISVKNGEEVNLENAKSTDYIPIGVYALQITQDEIIAYYSSLYGIAAYNSEKEFIKGWSGYPNPTPSIILPENTAYIRTCTTLNGSNSFTIKHNMFLGSKSNLIIQNINDIDNIKDDVETLKSEIGVGKAAYVIEPFKLNTYIVANVGQEPSYTSYTWCNTYRIDVNKGDIIWIYDAYVNQNRPAWITLDNNGRIVRISEYSKYGYTRRVVIEEGEVALIWTQADEKDVSCKGTYLIETTNDYVLNKGELLNLSAHKIQADSVNIQIVESKFKVGGITMFVAKGLDSNSEINIKINDNELFFAGIWFYMPTSIQKNIESIIIDGAEKKSLSFSACDIQLMTKYLHVTGSERTITIKVSLKESVPNTDLIFGGIIKNQIVKPVTILDFDSTYQYSEDEGVYDWILEESKLPMTIHVGELAQGSDGTITDWQKYINSGQVDIGTYGGSIKLHPTDWGGTDALKNDPYGEKCPSIGDMNNNINEHLDTFIGNYSVFPLSFGGQQYYCPKKSQKVLLNNGYRTTRLPTGNGSALDISFGVSYVNNRLIYGDSGYGANKINGAIKNLGVYNIFNHGLSDNHVGEGVYQSFSSFKESINALIKLSEEGTLLFLNYSMYYKILIDNNLIINSNCL